MTFLHSGHDLPSKQRVSRREKIGSGFRIGTSLVLLIISSCFRWIAYHSVPYRIFRMGTLSCSEGKGHTFESCRAHTTRCTRPHQTVTPPHLAATHCVDRSTVRGVELSGALLETDAVVIAMGALVADGRRVVGSASCLGQRATTRNARSESVVTSVGRPLVSTRKQSPDVIKHRSIV